MTESERSEEFCRQVVDHMLRLRGFHVDRKTCSGEPRCLSEPGYTETCNDIHCEIAGGRDPALDRIYMDGFCHHLDPKKVAEAIQQRIWDRR